MFTFYLFICTVKLKILRGFVKNIFSLQKLKSLQVALNLLKFNFSACLSTTYFSLNHFILIYSFLYIKPFQLIIDLFLLNDLKQISSCQNLLYIFLFSHNKPIFYFYLLICCVCVCILLIGTNSSKETKKISG